VQDGMSDSVQSAGVLAFWDRIHAGCLSSAWGSWFTTGLLDCAIDGAGEVLL